MFLGVDLKVGYLQFKKELAMNKGLYCHLIEDVKFCAYWMVITTIEDMDRIEDPLNYHAKDGEIYEVIDINEHIII